MNAGESSGAPVVATAAPADRELESLRSVVLVVYVLQALSLFVGLTAIAGIVINYIKRDDAKGTVFESHFSWQIRTFWWGLAWCVLGFVLLMAFGLGLVVWGVAAIWMIYRVAKGWIKLNEGKPVFPA